jgi:signal transduction histidine kinase
MCATERSPASPPGQAEFTSASAQTRRLWARSLLDPGSRAAALRSSQCCSYGGAPNSPGVVVSERSDSVFLAADVMHVVVRGLELDVAAMSNPAARAYDDTQDMIAAAAHVRLPAPQTIRHALAPVAARPLSDPVVAEFSHEVRSALGAIYNAAHLLRMQRSETAVAMKAGILIERQVLRMQRLVDDLLDITRVRGDALCLQYERVDLRIVVRHAIETLELDMIARGHHLKISLPAAPVWLAADAGRLEQVVVNLLGNAAKYTDPGGDVFLSVHQGGAQAILCVRDSGIGIAADVLPHVFDLYMQADPASRHAEAGLGIGLALVRSLVELHGGAVTATSAGLGYGSEFSVCLPLA